MIYAGSENTDRDNGCWIFVDIGYSSRAKSCCLLFHDGEPVELQFFQLKSKLEKLIQSISHQINLVLEAPLSCAYSDSGNPTGRTFEKRNSSTRYWYVGAGAAVLLGALDLMNALDRYSNHKELRLYEGFASFKDKASSHSQDVKDLRDILWSRHSKKGSIIPKDEIAFKSTDKIVSAFHLIGKDYGIPPIAVVGA